MDADTIIKGKVYVYGIKSDEKKNFAGPDVVYGVGYEHNDSVTISKFKDISERLEGKFCLTRKANKSSDAQCTWSVPRHGEFTSN